MSSITIVLVCSSIILTAWLIRMYQDGKLPFIANKKNPNNMGGMSNKFLTDKKGNKNKNLSQIVKQAFPEHVIKAHVHDANSVFICSKADETELAIIKVNKESEKKIQTMGGVVRVTYKNLPKSSELKQDLLTHIKIK